MSNFFFRILNYATKQVPSWSATPSACNATIRPQAAVNASTEATGVSFLAWLRACPAACLLQRRGLGDQVVARACGLWALGNKGRAPLELSQSHVTCMALASKRERAWTARKMLE